MSLLFKILFWIIILEIKLSQISLKNINSNVKIKNNFAYCFKCSKLNRSFKINGPREFINSYRNRLNNLSLVKDSDDRHEFGNVNSQYLTNLNFEIINLNNSIINNGSEQCYRDLERIIDMISEPISSLYTEPIEVDYNTKLKELNTKFGLNLDRIDPLFILKLSKYGKSKLSDISFEYLTQQKTDNGKIENKLWKRELKEDVPIDLIKQFTKALNGFSKTMGNFIFKFYKDEIPVNDLLYRASTLGLQATGELFDGLSLLQLKNNSNSENLKKSLDLIIHYSHLDSVRSSCYRKIMDHFFRKNDPESMLEVLKHYIKFSNKKINSLFLTQYLLVLGNKYENMLDELKENNKFTDFFNKNIEYVNDIFQFKANNNERILNNITEKKGEMRNENKEKQKILLLELKEKIIEILELYKEYHLSPFNFTSELAELLIEKYDYILPGLFNISLVSGNKDISGKCELCNTKIKFNNLNEDEKFDFLTKMLETLNSTCPSELPRLFNFYEFLKRAKMSGNQYTCVIDGMNIGYNRNTHGILNWFKLNYSFNFMKSTGENPIIVIPRIFANNLLKISKINNINGYKTINEMIQNGSIYLTDKNSYDDNYLLLAGMATFSDREMELFQKYFYRNNTKINQKDQFGYGSSSDIYNQYSNNYRYNSDTSNNYNITNTNTDNNSYNNTTEITKNVIILTNDRLSNLRIINLEKELLDKWMCYSLINFNSYISEGKETFVLGQRLKYTFDILYDKDRFHIPLGFDRVFTNLFEIHKCSFKIKTFDDNTSKIILNLYQNEDTPIKYWIRKNSKYLYPSHDERHNLSDYDYEINIKKDKINKKYDKNNHKDSDVFHRSPEIARMMFSPLWKSPWLCIDLTAFDKSISKL